MAIDLARFDKLKKGVEEAEAAANRAEGALGTLMARLAQEYGCKTEKEGERHLTDLEADAEEKEAAYNTALAEFERDWSGQIQNDGQ